MKKIICLIILIYNVFSISIYDVPNIVKKKSISSKKLKIELKINNLNIKSQFLDYFPSLLLNYSGNYNNLLLNNSTYSHNISLNSSWNIFNNFNTYLGHKINKLSYTNLQINYKKTENSEIYNNLLLYIKGIKNKLSYELVLSNEIIFKSQYEYVLSKKKQGIVSEIDLINAKAEYDNSLYNTKYYKILYNKSILDLEKSLRLTNININYFKIKNLTNISKHSLIINYINKFKNSLDEQLLNNDNKILKINKNINFRNLWIKNANINSSFNWYKFTYLSDNNYSTNKFLDYSFQISISFPIFDKFDNINLYKKILYQIKLNKIDKDNLYQTKIKDLVNIIDNYNDKIELLIVSKSRLESSKLSYNKMKESYTLGIASLLDLYLMEKKYRDAEKDYLLLKYDIIQIKINIAYFFNIPDKWQTIF